MRAKMVEKYGLPAEAKAARRMVREVLSEDAEGTEEVPVFMMFLSKVVRQAALSRTKRSTVSKGESVNNCPLY
ncbi:hypothetical protein GCM10027027_07560 [Neomicrococcus lactis]